MPLQVAFEADFDNPVWESVNFAIDVIFLCDIALNLRTSAEDPESNRRLSEVTEAKEEKEGGDLRI